MYSGAVPSIKAYRVTEDWTSDSLTWNNKPEYTSTDASLTATMSSNNWYRAYVTAIVKSWLKGTYRNDGFLLKDETESGTSQWTTFYSSDAASPNKPELIINYSSVRPLKTYDYYLYKNSAMSTSTTTLHNYLDIASDAIKSAYNVSFNRLSTTSSSAFNQRTGCTRTVSQICTSSSCGAVSECTDIHHKAGYYFLYVNKIGIAKVFRYVDYALCRTKSSKHGQIYGAASGDDKNVIISLQAPNIQRTTCHELSHCIGANDGVCVSGQACVMTYGSNVYNLWCTECAKDIANFLD